MSRILVVDDESSIRISLKHLLGNAGYEVETAEDAETAIDMLGTENFDIVLSDIIMPRITGLKLLQRIKDTSPNVLVLLMTGEPSLETASEAVRAGAADYLSKPIRKEELLKSVSNVIRLKALNDEKERLEQENLTYQKNLEQLVMERTSALVKSEKHFRSVVESASDAIITIDSSGLVISCNEATGRMFGVTSAEMIGKPLGGIMPDRYRLEHEQGTLRVARGALSRIIGSTVEVVGLRRTGEEFPIELTLSQWESNGEIHFTAIIRDITEREQAAEALRQAGEIVSSSTDMLALLNKDFQFLRVNKHFAETFDMAPDEFGGKLPSAIFGKEHFEAFILPNARTCLEGEHVVYEATYDTPHKGPQEMEIHYYPYYNKKGQIDGFVSNARNITQRNKALRALQQSEARFSAFMRNLPAAAFIKDQNSVNLYVNDYMKEVFGEKDWIGNTNDKLFPEGVGAGMVQDDMETLRAGQTQVVGMIPDKSGRELYFETHKFIIERDGLSPQIGGFAMDVTARKLIEEDLEQALTEAKHANEVKDQFIANMSHEIRTPLNSILGFIQLLRIDLGEKISAKTQDYFTYIQKGADRLLRTVHQILDISQLEAGIKSQPQDSIALRTLISQVIHESMLRVEEKGLSLTFKSDVENPIIKADEYSITQAVSNIIDNAIKYTKEGSIDVSLHEESGALKLVVKDTGIGISEEYLGEIFEVFSQESVGYTRLYQGLGLGLPLTKRYLENNNARIEVESTKGMGTTITIHFPAQGGTA